MNLDISWKFIHFLNLKKMFKHREDINIVQYFSDVAMVTSNAFRCTLKKADALLFFFKEATINLDV